jgi:STE24 endopeptidase
MIEMSGLIAPRCLSLFAGNRSVHLRPDRRLHLGQSKASQFELTYDVLVLILVLFSGVLPWWFARFQGGFWDSNWGMAAALFLLATALSIFDLPFSWYAQFRLEERFGFNTSTQALWWSDRLKALLLALVLGYPLLVLILFLVNWTGRAWWIWAWAALLAFSCWWPCSHRF